MKNLLGKFHAELSQQVSFFGFLSGKFHEKFVRKISCRAYLTKASEPSRAKPSRAEPSQAKPSQAKFAYYFLFVRKIS